ncbi:restriction endonuclease-like protein [Pontibacillus salipaludis]|uniref:restriction endonuclease-like protein n=1 Tax=Pontibacillus salipaludis TaxID=1697394 RepID=UPI0031EA8A2D
MDSHLSGAADGEVELVEIETEAFSLYIKGKPYHHRYESLKHYQKVQSDENMHFSFEGEAIESVRLFDVQTEELSESTNVSPLFFENGTYQLVVTPKNGYELHFHHEHPSLRKAVSRVGKPPFELLMGNLTFTNEVGFTTFSIGTVEKKVLEVTLEIFPSKLSYKEDYQKLLEEVNEEVYNLAYHFVKKTYLGATTSLTVESSWSEFYRLLMQYYKQFTKAIAQIEKQPHHQLIKEHALVRGDQLKKQDSKGRKFLRKRLELFTETQYGIPIGEKKVMPTKGLNVQKRLSFDTLENQFVKWMMTRIIHKVESLKETLRKQASVYQTSNHDDKLDEIEAMEAYLKKKIRSSFWREISSLDRSVMSLVLQMAPGYREAYQTYLILSRGLILHGELARMSVKDVATLYEYWTFLKLGQILGSKYEMISQDIIKVNREGLFVTLNQSASAKRVFRHPHTKERITLYFQKHSGKVPTVKQKPDSMLSIEKSGKDRTYEYVFDAKYRVDFAVEDSYYHRAYHTSGPLEEDINTMHRYRDSLVEGKEGAYERYTFGAYVLFPWGDEHEYEKHQFYKSIQKVNIGGFPFLPNSTLLVERFLDRLIEASPQQIQQEGILPKGTLEEWESDLVERVCIIKVTSQEEFVRVIQQGRLKVAADWLNRDWHKSSYVGLYKPRNVFGDQGGVSHYAKVGSVDVEDSSITFTLQTWQSTRQLIKPVGYGIRTSAMTDLESLKHADELPQLFMKSNDERHLWNLMRRFTKQIIVSLDHEDVGEAERISTFQSQDGKLTFEIDEDSVYIRSASNQVIISKKDCVYYPNKVFRQIVNIL